MSKGKFLSKLSFFKKKKRVSRESLRSNSTTSYTSHNMEAIPEIVRGNTVPASSINPLESSIYSNKRKNISHSSIEAVDKKQKQPYVDSDHNLSYNCPIPTPVDSATTSSVGNTAAILEDNSKKESGMIASSSSLSYSLNNNEREDMNVEENSEVKKSNKSTQKVQITSNQEEARSSTPSENHIRNNNLETPPHTPTATIFVTSKSTVSSIEAYDVNENGNPQPATTTSTIQDNNSNEVKPNTDDLDLYVGVFNRLTLDNQQTTEPATEETPNRLNGVSTEYNRPGDNLTTESLTPIPSVTNIQNIQYHPQPIPSNLSIVQNITPNEITPPNNNAVNTLNTNTKKEAFNNDTTNLKIINENKKDKIIEDESSIKDKENITNENKATNNDLEKYLEKEATHTIAESMDVLNNTIEMLKCGICLDILLDPKIVEPCGHSFCNHCLRMLQTRVCPLCRTRIHDYHSSVLLNELSELIAKYSLDKEQLEERNQCCQEIEEKDKHLNDECMRLMELMELAHQSDNTNNYSVQFQELVELNETDDDI